MTMGKAMNDHIGDDTRLPRRRAPEGFADRVMARVSQLTPAAPRPRLRSRILHGLPMAAALAMALGLSGAGLFRLVHERAPEAPTFPVELELPAAEAHTVSVAGDFNEWQNARMNKGTDGVWRIRLSLPPGRYQYAFVVDNNKWMADPHASTLVDSGYSGANSVLDVSL
jgi:hypothetical protein